MYNLYLCTYLFSIRVCSYITVNEGYTKLNLKQLAIA